MARGRQYTEQEDEKIRELFAKRVSARGIGAILNRTAESIHGRMHYLGLRRKWHWSPEDDNQLRALGLANLPDKEIAIAMERTVSGVRRRLFDLGVKRDARKTRLAVRYGVDVIANGKEPAQILAELREAEELQRETANAERQAKIDRLLNEMERGLTAGCDRAFMFTAALVGGATLQAIGDRVGITRERVRQVIEKRAANANGESQS